MARGKKKRVRYMRTKLELQSLNAVSLAAYIKRAFRQAADKSEGQEALLAKALKLHEVNRRPLIEESDGNASAPANRAPAKTSREEGDAMARMAGSFVDAIEDRLGSGKRKKEEPPPCEPNERYIGGLRVTEPGDFPEAVQYPVLQGYRRERDGQDLAYFRSPEGKRVMLGKIVEVFPQEGFQGAVHACVNGLQIAVPREKQVGVPLPHFEQIRNANDAAPKYDNRHDVPVGSALVPDAPPPPMIVRRATYNMGVYGDCLCNPLTLKIEVVLTQLVSTMRSIPAEQMQIVGSAI